METDFHTITNGIKIEAYGVSFNCRPMTVEEETERVRNTLEKAQWYKQHGYFNILQFPEHSIYQILETPEAIESASFATQQIVRAEYDPNSYKPTLDLIRRDAESIKQAIPILLGLKSAVGLEIFNNYQVMLTRYGTGGSFDETDGSIIRRATPTGMFLHRTPAMTILHETIHIALENIVTFCYGMGQVQKEVQVDSMVQYYFGHLLPGYLMQADIAPAKYQDYLALQ